MEENKFTIINPEGKEIECTALFQFECEETEKKYVVYTDNTFDENGSARVYAATYDDEDEEGMDLHAIETDEEWEMIESVLADLAGNNSAE